MSEVNKIDEGKKRVLLKIERTMSREICRLNVFDARLEKIRKNKIPHSDLIVCHASAF